MAAQKLGIKKVPCVEESHLTETQKRAYILADNKIALDAGWDAEMLTIELKDLQEQYFDMDLIGFTDEEINNYLSLDSQVDDKYDVCGEDEKEVVIDEETESITEEGNIWILGEHRLICGDSTKKDVVEKLFSGEKPNLMVTDPPYGVNYDGYRNSKRRRGKVLNDDKECWKDAYALFPGDIAYVWHPDLHFDVIYHDLKTCGFKINSIIIWNKDHFSLGFSDYQWKHEPCVYATKGNHNWQGGRDQTTVWDIPSIRCLEKSEGSWLHSTQKPIECMKRPIENNSVRGEWVYDQFCGSGTTVIACERTGRRCLSIELSPRYCDAIVRRWEKETGGSAILENGVRFDDLELQRFGRHLDF